MKLKELTHGESKSIEFKESIPENTAKYMKTVVAYANGSGGKLIFGIQDKTNKIVGINPSEVFTMMDSITNAISDSCEPVIVPDISLQEIEGKTLIVVEVAPGMQRPYYIKSKGMMKGTFIRVAGTTRPVEPYMLKELILEGSGRSFDSMPVEDQRVTQEEIDRVCLKMTEYALKSCKSDQERENVHPLTCNKLLSWELLVERNGEYIPTYGYNLLAGRAIPSVMAEIQCAVFKGNNRAVFVDRKTYGGPIYEQIDAAYDFVLRMIRMGAVIEGIARQDVYEFPLGTVREMICNAVCHRAYLQPSNVQVALYDNRLEVTSPGMLSRDLTIERMKEGYSKIRNRGIANAFAYMKIIEGWGSGIPRMIEECKEYGLREPELIDAEGDFRINLYRNNAIESNLDFRMSEMPQNIDIVQENTKKSSEKRQENNEGVPENTRESLGSKNEISENVGKCREIPERIQEGAGKCRKNPERIQESAGKCQKNPGRIPESAGQCQKSSEKVPESAGKYQESSGKVPENAGKILEECRENPRRVPEKSRKSAGKIQEEHQEVQGNKEEYLKVLKNSKTLSEQQKRICAYIYQYHEITSAQAGILLNVKARRARSVLNEMTQKNLLEKVGASRNTKYVLKGETDAGFSN